MNVFWFVKKNMFVCRFSALNWIERRWSAGREVPRTLRAPGASPRLSHGPFFNFLFQKYLGSRTVTAGQPLFLYLAQQLRTLSGCQRVQLDSTFKSRHTHVPELTSRLRREITWIHMTRRMRLCYGATTRSQKYETKNPTLLVLNMDYFLVLIQYNIIVQSLSSLMQL